MSRKRKQDGRDEYTGEDKKHDSNVEHGAATDHDEDTVSIDESIDDSDAINDADNAHAGDNEPIVDSETAVDDDDISDTAKDELHQGIDSIINRAVVRDGVMTITADMIENIDRITNDTVMREFLRDDLRDTLAEVTDASDDPDDDYFDDDDDFDDERFLEIGDELISRLSTSKDQRGAYAAANKNVRVLRDELRKPVIKLHVIRKAMQVVDASILGSMASEDARSDAGKLSIIDSNLVDNDSRVARSVDNAINNVMVSLDTCHISIMAIMSVMIGLEQWYSADESINYKIDSVFNALNSELDDADTMEKLFFRDVNLVLLDKKIGKMRHLLRMTPSAFPELIDQEIVDTIIAGPVDNDDKDYPTLFDHNLDYRIGLDYDQVLIKKITDEWISILRGDDEMSIPIDYEFTIWSDWRDEGFEPGVRSMIINDALNDEIGALTGIQVDNPNDDYHDYLYEDDADELGNDDDADSTSDSDGTGIDGSRTSTSDGKDD